MAPLLYASVLILTIIAWQALALLRNYKAAQSIGLPVLISPTATLNPLWIIGYKVFPGVIPLLRRLPFGAGRWARYTYMGWQFDDKRAIHDELGPAFVLCTPGINEVIVADPTAVHTILTRRKDFVKPGIMYDGLNVFGPNLDSVEGETWQRHRRLTAPNFNERVSASAWAEAIGQARQMLQAWLALGEQGTRDTVDDAAALALHVLTYAGFGVKYAFKDSETKLKAPHRLTYRDALLCVIRNFTLLVMVPMRFMSSPIMPRSVRKVGEACDEFKLYMREMVQKERAAADTRPEGGADHLLSNLVRASSEAAAGHSEAATDSESGKLGRGNSSSGSSSRSGAPAKGLSDSELYGNLFIYAMAGHESTANTLATSIAYLAAEPRWQAWLHEEISQTLGAAAVPPSSPSDDWEPWPYDQTFPLLPRCLAVMHETLRLHGSTVFLPKSTPSSSSTSQYAPHMPLSIADRTYSLPPATFVIVNSQAVHTDPAIWGPDALDWRPDRWIERDAATGREAVRQMKGGEFVGWADGPRVCPGRKFSMVEFVGALAVLVGEGMVEAKRRGQGESPEQARSRLRAVIEDAGIAAITLQIRRPREVELVWRRRGREEE